MVNMRAAKIALVVAGVLLVTIFAGQLLRRLTWMLSWAMLVGIVTLVAYGVYELKKGWSDAGESQDTRDDTQTHSETSTDSDSVADLQQSYVDSNLSEEELEAELEALMDDDDRDLERELRE